MLILFSTTCTIPGFSIPTISYLYLILLAISTTSHSIHDERKLEIRVFKNIVKSQLLSTYPEKKHTTLCPLLPPPPAPPEYFHNHNLHFQR